ncbi:contactin-associated protein 1 [Discoglossus pictus]
MLHLEGGMLSILLFIWAGILQGGHLILAERCYNDLISPLYFTSFDASSRYSIFYNSNFARLYGSSGWSPAPGDKQPWLQIDLKQKYKIMGVATQGTYNTYYDWVTKYILLYGDRPDSWKPFFQQGSNWTFFGNVNTTGVKEHRLYYPIKARYVRFIPVAWNPRGKIGLRVALYGCPYRHDVLSFDGDDLIAYQFRGKLSRSLRDDISFNFKTLEKEGILMHAEGTQGDYITLELQKAQLIFKMSLGNSPIHPVDSHTILTLGSLLDDQHWHSIHIERYGRHLNVTLDGEIQRVYSKGDFEQLDLDTEIFFAGLVYQDKSITHKQNFRGCLENIIFNGINIADLARRKKSSIRFVGKVRYSCIEMPYVPVTFPGVNNYLMVPGVPANTKMVVSFSFRTWDMVGLLLYTSFAGNMGSLEMALSEGQINVSISQPNTKKLMFAAGYRLNDGFWHSVYLLAQENSAMVIIDEDEGAAFKIEYKFQLRTGDTYYFGGCPKPALGSGCYSNQTAFHGCMQMLSVDRQPVDLHRMQLRWLGRFSEVMFNVCAIADRCRPNPCEHGGRCYQSWDDFFCVCDMTGYKGETCHKSLYKENCEAYRISGKYSGNFTIDPDGSGPVKPFSVYCDIRDEIAWTIVENDRYYRTKVTGSSPNEPFLGEVHYQNASWNEVSALANGSEYCEQKIEFSCYKSRLLNSPSGLPFSFWMGRNNERHFYWGGSNPGIQRCDCGLKKNCADPRYHCNCDADHLQWRYDSGLLNFRDHLPITRVVVGDTNRSSSEAWFSVGSLRCYGDRNSWNTVTFMKGASLIFPTFRPDTSIDISFFFKTTAQSGTFLENTGNRFLNFIRIELNTTHELAFVFDVGDGHENVTVKSPFRFNNDEWHEVKAEISVKLARIKVDRLPWVIRNYPHRAFINISYDRPLYVGSAESKYRPFIGCLRGLRMNGVTLDLEGKANESLGVRTNCTGYCERPRIECQNRGRCVERYSHYTCDCNGTGFEGPFCTIDIGAYFEAGTWVRHNILSAAMFAVQEFASIAFLPPLVSNLTREEISFSFSTTMAPAVLFYVSSFASDYIAVLLRPEGTLQLNYQVGKSPYVYQLSRKNMTDGLPHKVNITREYRTLYIQVDYYPMMTKSFSLLEDRKFDSPKAVYLGRVMETGPMDSEVQKFNTPGFRGCLADVRFNNITPIRDIFRPSNSGAVITVKGSLVESNCAAMPMPLVLMPFDMDPWYMGTVFPHYHDDGLAGIIAFIVIFLFLIAIICLFVAYHYFHRYKGSYLTNEPKAIDAPSATKPASSRKEQPLPQIEEEGAKSE